MARNNRIAQDANRFTRPDDILRTPECNIRGCRQPPFSILPVCFDHGLQIWTVMHHALDKPISHPEPRPQSTQPAYVYYLMLSPTTIKIGTTRNLEQRLSAMRADPQYVVAIERGSFDIERQRHTQFAADRRGPREDFHLSEALKAHIDTLIPHRDQLVTEALTPPRQRRQDTPA